MESDEQLRITTLEIFAQLKDLCKQLSHEEYSKSLELLMENSIGKHVRHILDFFDCLKQGISDGNLNYDKRERCLNLEEKPEIAIAFLNHMESWVKEISHNQELNLQINYNNSGQEETYLLTNFSRELAYNIEHAIHHMTIMRIALENKFPNIKVNENFGIAYSTLQYRSEPCAR